MAAPAPAPNPLDAFEAWVYAEQLRLLAAMKAAADAGRDYSRESWRFDAMAWGAQALLIYRREVLARIDEGAAP